MHRALAVLVLVLPVFGAQSVQVTSTCLSTCPFVALPNSAPWTTIGHADQRFEARVENISSSTKFQLGSMVVFVGSGTLQVTNAINPPATDTLGSQTGSIACCAGYGDVLVQLQRNNAAQTLTLQMCATTGGSCQVATWAITTPGQLSWAGFTIELADSVSGFAWLRWYSTLAPTANLIRNAGTPPQLADWEFEGNLNDSVNSLNMGGAGVTVSYSTTATYAPSCAPLVQQTFVVGGTGTLDATQCQPLDNGATMTYLWSYAGAGSDGVTQSSLVFGTATSVTTTISGFSRGSVNVMQTVTDGSSQSASFTTHHGAVVADANDVVATGLPNEDILLGSMLRYGSPKNRAPLFDYWNKLSLDTQGAALTTQFPDYWDSPSAGTVQFGTSVSCGGGGSGQGLIGTGTNFNTISPGDYIVIYWNSGANRQLNTVDSVSSSTCLQMHYAWNMGTSETGQHFVASPDPAAVGHWAYAQISTPGNYYDNCKAYKAMYRRSGIDTYWDYYTYICDKFRSMPANDQGLSYSLNNQSQFKFPGRSQSLEGMFLRAMDPGMSGMWPGLRVQATFNEAQLTQLAATGWAGNDEREIAYAQLFTAYQALFDPDQSMSGPADVARGVLSATMPFFTSGLQPDGSFATAEYTLFDTTNKVTVTQGSPTVTCSGCNFTGMFDTSGCSTSGHCAPYFATFTGNTVPTTNTPFSGPYKPTVTNSTTLTLNKNYAENSGSYYWARDVDCQCAPEIGPIGWYIQPFMEAIQVTSFVQTGLALTTSDPTNSALAYSYAQTAATHLTAYGYGDPAHSGLGGMTYFAGALNCAHPVQTMDCVNTTDPSEQRTDSAESIRALSQTYVLAPTPTKLAFLRTLFDAMYCKPGVAGLCTSDGNYIHQFDDNGGYIINPFGGIGHKWTGFFFGYSANINGAAAGLLAAIASSVSRGGVPHGIVLH